MPTAAERARAAAIAGLAVTHGLDLTAVETAIAGLGGDGQLELDSKTAEFLIASIEVEFGVQLPTPADLGRAKYATLGALLAAITVRLSAAS
jgi:acyl carrier protein